MHRRVIQFELNEISKQAIDHLIAQGKLPYFARMNQYWSYFKTTSEKQYQHLEPWIQWISAHTGKSFDEHQIFRLSDAVSLQHPQIWETLSDAGIESCIVGSMNATRGKAYQGFFLPDPWSKSGKTYPTALQPLWDLISRKVQSHATAPIKLKDLLKGFQLCRQFKLPIQLYKKIALQLFTQKIDPLKKWKMAALFDELLTGIFKHLLKSTQYRYYTLFLNSIAHYQHHYWRQFQPELFDASIQSPDCHSSDNPMVYGYEQYDRIIQLALELAKDPTNLVIVVSGLSQEPFTDKENESGMNYYRLINHADLIKCLNLTNCRALPLMSRDWQIETKTPTQLMQIKLVLSQIMINDKPLFSLSQNTPLSLFIETAITEQIAPETTIQLGSQSIGQFHQYFKTIAVKSGHHSGTGSLWLSKPMGIKGNTLPLTALYPLTLEAFEKVSTQVSWDNVENIA